jgi:DNA recombination protein RmuC
LDTVPIAAFTAQVRHAGYPLINHVPTGAEQWGCFAGRDRISASLNNHPINRKNRKTTTKNGVTPARATLRQVESLTTLKPPASSSRVVEFVIMEDVLLIAFGIIIVVLTAFSLRTSRLIRVERELRISSETKLSHLEGCEADLDKERQEVIRLVGLSSEFEDKSARLPDLELEIADLSARLTEATKDAASLRTAIDEREKAHTKQIEALTAGRDEIHNNLKVIAADSLKDNQTSFLRLANEVFEKHKEGAASELGERQTAFGALLEPITVMLNDYQEKIAAIERNRHEAYGALTEELKSVAATQNGVRTETARLVNALRAAPKTRGRWGEHTLQRVIELAGLSSHCDFEVEKTLSDGSLRPDLIIHLPGGRSRWWMQRRR